MDFAVMEHELSCGMRLLTELGQREKMILKDPEDPVRHSDSGILLFHNER